MGCLSKATGGQLIEAADTDAAIAGLNRIVLAMRGVAPRRPSAVAAPPPAVAKPAAAPLVAGLDLTARLAGSQTPIPSGLTWRIESTTNPAAPVSHTSTAVAPQLALPPGDYRVTLETATKRFEKTAAVVAGTRTPIVFELDGGTIDVRVGDGASGAPAPDTIVTVARRDGPGAGGAVWAGPASAAQALIVAAGSYIVTAGNGLLQRSVQVDVAAGAARHAVPGERPSRLIVSATGLDARTLSEMTISIAVDDTTAPGGRRTIARSTAAKAEFFLKPGPYHVTLSALDTENRGVVVLGAGQTATLALPLQKMALSVTTHVGTGDKLDGGDLRYRLWRADQLERPIAVSGVAQPVFHLVPGKYRIESRIDLQNAVMIREFDVGPGALGSLELRHRAGRVDFAFPAGGGGEAGAEIGTYWEIVDEQGQLIWRAFGQARNVTLAAGAYQVSAEYKDQRYSAKFTVVAGRREAVDLVKN